MTIRDLVKERGIKFLLHFTRAENLDTILRHGLLPKDQLAGCGVAPTINDELRLDGHPNALCVSISFPNYKMFYFCRQKDKAAQWVVLVIDPRVLWEKDCAFCVENAASNAVTAVALEARRGRAALERMFDEYPGKPTRAGLRISDGSPTNPQAEVLVFEPIEPERIIGVAFNDPALLDKYKRHSKGKQMELIPGLFRPRVDYLHWK